MMDHYNDMEVRESVFVQSCIEGYLDKKESGVLRTKTARRWCWVQGSIFYQQKSSAKDNNPGAINVIDMSDVHSVKNLPTDTTGTQFEIFLKKGQVYICSSREECTAWIQALQKAMAFKGSRQTEDSCNPTFYTSLPEEDRHVYTEVNEAVRGHQMTASKLHNGHGNASLENNMNAENIYSTPEDSVENIYNDVDKIPRETVQGIPLSSEKIARPLPSKPDTNNDGNDPVYSINDVGYSTEPLENNSCSADKTLTGTKEGECSYAEDQLKQSRYIKNDSHKGQRSLSPSQKAPMASHIQNRTLPSTSTTSQATLPTPAPNIVEDSDQVEETINSEDQLLDIFNSMDIESTVEDLGYVIKNDDAKPVTDLKNVLRQNDVHCRISTNRLSKSEDPVAACRSYLSTLDNVV